MTVIEKQIELDVPVHVAYNQWTQFEQFPQFMQGVSEVHQVDETHLHWRADILGVSREWDAEITEQRPDELVAWRSVDGPKNDGRVAFTPIADSRTSITVLFEFEPQGFTEKAGDALNVIDRRIEGDLKRFREFIESHGSETGAWRGEVEGGQLVDDGTQASGSTGSRGPDAGQTPNIRTATSGVQGVGLDSTVTTGTGIATGSGLGAAAMPSDSLVTPGSELPPPTMPESARTGTQPGMHSTGDANTTEQTYE